MILSFNNELSEIEKILDIQIPPTRALEVASVLMGLLDRGIGMEQKRIIDIIQRKGMNPQPLIQEIRRPLR